jgi:membrane protein implicated in regulation of membrane protease activity
MAEWLGWLALAGVVVILELFTGTFYLLMISVGLIAGGLAAFFAASREMQFITAAVVGVLAVYALRRSRYGKRNKVDPAYDRNVNLDIGETIHIKNWSSKEGEVSTARTMYRGAMWDIQLAHGSHPNPGPFVIKEVRGSRLIVANHNSN